MLTRWASGNQPKIEIDAAQYAASKDALEIQGVALEIEEKFNLVMANYEEFEREILTITLAYMVRTNPIWGGMFSDRLLLNRRIVNLLNTGKLYVDQVKNSVNKSATQIGCPREQSEAVFSEQQEKAPGYRIVAALRHHFQHRSLAILNISYPSSIEIKTEAEREDEPLWSFGLGLELDMAALRKDRRFRGALKELESLQPNQNDIILLIRQYVEGLGHAQNQLRKLIELAVDKADATSNAALTEWQAAGHSTTGLVASNFCDGSTAEEHVVVTDNLKKTRMEMEAAHNSFTNLSRRFVSSVRPHDAYPRPSDERRIVTTTARSHPESLSFQDG